MKIEVVNADVVMASLRATPSRVGRAVVLAMNRAITSSRAAMVREVARDTGLRATDVRNAMPVKNATSSHPEAKFGASLRRIPLYQFHARGDRPTRGRGRGVSYRLPGGRGRIPDAFLAKFASGHVGVFARAGTSVRESKGAWSKNLPIRELFGPSLGHVFEKYAPLGLARLREAFHVNFDHELSRLVPGLEKRERRAARGYGADV